MKYKKFDLWDSRICNVESEKRLWRLLCHLRIIGSDNEIRSVYHPFESMLHATNVMNSEGIDCRIPKFLPVGWFRK